MSLAQQRALGWALLALASVCVGFGVWAQKLYPFAIAFTAAMFGMAKLVEVADAKKRAAYWKRHNVPPGRLAARLKTIVNRPGFSFGEPVGETGACTDQYLTNVGLRLLHVLIEGLTEHKKTSPYMLASLLGSLAGVSAQFGCLYGKYKHEITAVQLSDGSRYMMSKAVNAAVIGDERSIAFLTLSTISETHRPTVDVEQINAYANGAAEQGVRAAPRMPAHAQLDHSLGSYMTAIWPALHLPLMHAMPNVEDWSFAIGMGIAQFMHELKDAERLADLPPLIIECALLASRIDPATLHLEKLLADMWSPLEHEAKNVQIS